MEIETDAVEQDWLPNIDWPSNYILDPFDWSAFSAVVALIGLGFNLLLLATVYFGFRSVRDGQAAHVSNILIWAAAQMDLVKSDIIIIQRSSFEVGEWSDEYRAAAARVSAVYQRLGYMAYHGLIKPVHFKRMWGLSFVILWRDLEPWVKDMRKNNGEPEEINAGAFSRVDFERMAKKYDKDYREMADRMINLRRARIT